MWGSGHKFLPFIWAYLFENVAEHSLSPKMFPVVITDSAETVYKKIQIFQNQVPLNNMENKYQFKQIMKMVLFAVIWMF